MNGAALALLLAQTCVAEIDLQPTADECAVMWAVNSRTAARRGVPLSQHTREFNAYWGRRAPSRPWIRYLSSAGAQPAQWPASRSWERERPRWLAYVAAAVAFVAKPALGLCPAAEDYGGTPGDGRGADDDPPCARARRVRCLPVELQAYWNLKSCRRRSRTIPAKVAAGTPR